MLKKGALWLISFSVLLHCASACPIPLSAGMLVCEDFDEQSFQVPFGTWDITTGGTTDSNHNYAWYLGRGGTGYSLGGGNSTDNDVHVWWFPNGGWTSDEFYVSFWIRYPRWVQNIANENVKLFYPHWDGANSYTAYGLPDSDTIYHSAHNRTGGILDQSNYITCPGMTDGNWHRYEFYIKFSEGIDRFWYDGQLKMNLRYGTGQWTNNMYYFMIPAEDSQGWTDFTRYIDDLEIWDRMPTSTAECTVGQTRACSTGEQGICAAGNQACTDGMWGTCTRTNNATIEICADSLDNDCDGATDCADSNCQCTCTDTDSDGYGNPASTYCSHSQFDCNNNNRYIFPTNSNRFCDCDNSDGYTQGTNEVCSDGTDQDCTGTDLSCSVCSQGQIASRCNCGGSVYSIGYCCNNVWQSGQCNSQAKRIAEINFEGNLNDLYGWVSAPGLESTVTYVSGYSGLAARSSHTAEDGDLDFTIIHPTNSWSNSNELLIQFWVKYEPEYYGLCSNGLWNVKWLWTQGTDAHTELIFQSYNNATKRINLEWQLSGGSSGWDSGSRVTKYGNFPYTFGEWMFVEEYMKLSSSETHLSNDGTMWVKVNGITIINDTDVITGIPGQISSPAIKASCSPDSGQGWWQIDSYKVWDGIPYAIRTCAQQSGNCCTSGQTCPGTTFSASDCNLCCNQACITPPQQCSDGTLYNQCSATKPLYCSNGNLINNCQTCSCSSGICQQNGSCGQVIPQNCEPADSNQNNIIEISELMNYTEQWQRGDIIMASLNNATYQWKNGC